MHIILFERFLHNVGIHALYSICLYSNYFVLITVFVIGTFRPLPSDYNSNGI